VARASWNGATLAEADAVHVVEGNVYFPPEAVRREHLRPSDTTSRCVWKGKASYYHVVVDGAEQPDAAWTYRKPWPLARKLRDHVAFGGGVEVTR